ncbi:MAG TPA: NAD(P)-dependent oxidoreductase [Acidimicrobiales bacterium]|nr:NAD(P)-dependent oxidoreductase [Acidimicrobiales bacterium]
MNGAHISGAKVLVTGPAGNLGWPVARALAADNEVWGLARFSDPAARARVEAARIRTVAKDIGVDHLDDLPADFDYVFHAASLIPMVSERDMARTFEINTQGTARLLAHCSRARSFVFCSTAGVYRHQPRPLVEDDDYGVDVPAYAMSKVAAEQAVRYLSGSAGIPAVILRVGALYGPDGGSGGATAPIDRMVAGKEIWVNPVEPRGVSLLWEDDAVRLAVRAFSVGQVPPLVLNFAGEEQVPVEEYCTFAGELVGRRPRFRYTDQAYPANPLDTARMRQVLGRCHTSWREGIRTVVERRYPHLLRSG